MRCSKCGADNREGRKFCAECGEALASKCPRCGATNESREKFCGECGAALGTSQSATARKSNEPQIRIAETSPPENLEGERKTVTALFADIKGSMDLIEDLDPEEARAIVDPALKLMMEAVQRYRGYVAQSTGDGIFALFGAPVAHEDHPQRALLAALRMQAEVKRYADKLRAEKGVNLQVRVGANTGEVVVREIRTGEKHTEYLPIGHSTSVAARLQALAAPGSIAITESVRKLIEGYFAIKSLGPARIKGVSEPLEIYEVSGPGPLRTRLQREAARGYTKFVGRQREMETLKHAAELAQEGHGQIVAAVAEPGVGKSRLFFEFKAKSQSGWMVLEAFSVSHDKASAYLPVLDLLHSYFKIASDDDARSRREKVAGKIAVLDRSLEDTLPYLYALLGIVEGMDPLAQMDGQVKKRRTLDAIKRILLRESLNQPLMVIFEDLHWIDDQTQEFLNLLADSLANTKILLLVNYRPEYSHQWGSKTYYTQLRLDPLGKESAEEMLSARIGDSPELAPLKQLVLGRTQGNPLFIEELIEALFDEGVLVRNGTVTLTRPLGQLKIPPTVQGILAARIDRLPPEAKELLQTLAVIGMHFSLALARAVVQRPPEQLDRLLSYLQAGEFVYEQPTADVEYEFKHALTHDEAYKSLLTDRRMLLHERTGQAIEALYHERLEDHYADLAYHYGSSNNAAKTIEYLRLAGGQAVDRGAYAQALANVEPAVKLIEQLPEGTERLRAELDVRLVEGMAVSPLYGLASTERLHTYQRVCELSARLGDISAEVQGRINVAGVYMSRGEVSRSLEIMQRCVELAQRSPGGELIPVVHLQLAIILHDAGDSVQASSLLSDLITHFEPARQEAGSDYLPINPWVLTPTVFSRVQHTLGRPDEALKLSELALHRARQLKRPFTISLAYVAAATLHYERRELVAARDLAEAAIAVADEHGFENHLVWGRSVRGWVLAESGQTAKGIAELEANATQVLANFQMQVSEMLAQAYLRAGSAHRAVSTLDEALSRSELAGTHFYDASLHRLKGEAILMRDSSMIAQAEECFRKGIGMARSRSAKSWELRATTSLARLLRDTGRRDEARAMLGEIYGWFTEGFDTADLKDAKALLEELSRSP
ncbi:MAG TPA: adenylate/guanylate cyclase domain-containing protein [Myxococcaceae bacterium]|nr:adenylate/guanylate cyclase domain-containing protein [Myxococcaceae bacterium]